MTDEFYATTHALHIILQFLLDFISFQLKPDHIKQNLFLFSLLLCNLNKINFDLPNVKYNW